MSYQKLEVEGDPLPPVKRANPFLACSLGILIGVCMAASIAVLAPVRPVYNASKSSEPYQPATPIRKLTIDAIGEHTATAIFLHGYNGNLIDMAPMQYSLDNPPHLKCVVPAARYNYMHQTCRDDLLPAWYDLREQCLGLDADPDEANLTASANTVHNLIEAEIQAGLPPERIIVGGFSQGSVISILTALTSRHRLGGLVVMAGYVPLPKKLAGMMRDGVQSLPILWLRGEDDPVIGADWVNRSFEWLDDNRFTNVRRKEYPGLAHSMSYYEWADIRTFMDEVLP